MALELKIEKNSITSDCSTLNITDQTGNYDVTTNPGGFGGPNEIRANLYIKLFLTNKKSTGDVAIAIDPYDENTVASWSIPITEDGYYEVFSFACLAWGSGITYQTGYIAYDAATDKFYKSLQDSNTNHLVTDTAWWAEATTIDEFLVAVNASQPDTYYDIYSYIELCRSVECRNDAILKEADCNCIDKCIIKDYEKLRTLIEAIQIKAASLEYTNAQVIVERVQEICANLPDCGCSH